MDSSMLFVKDGNSLGTALENFKLLQKHIFFCSQSLLLQWLRAFCFCLGDVQPCSAHCPPLLLLASSGWDKSDFEEFGLASSQHTRWARCFWQTWVSVHGGTSPQATFPSVGAIPSPVSNVLAWQCGGEPEQSWGSHLFICTEHHAEWHEVIIEKFSHLERAWVSLYILMYCPVQTHLSYPDFSEGVNPRRSAPNSRNFFP